MEDRYIFKAKRIDNGEWVIGNLITNVFFRLGQSIPYILCPDKAKYDCFEDFTEGNGIFEVRPDTICRCTGSKDKNGNLIWENDITQHRDSDEIKKAYIKYSAPFFVLHSTLGIYSSDTLADFSKIEVIGNKFDNLELLGRNDE